MKDEDISSSGFPGLVLYTRDTKYRGGSQEVQVLP